MGVMCRRVPSTFKLNHVKRYRGYSAANPRHGRVAWSFSALPPYPFITGIFVISLAGLLLSTPFSKGALRMTPVRGDDTPTDYHKINAFFGRFTPATDSTDGGEEAQTITKTGKYYDETLPMDGKIRVDKEGKGTALFPPPFSSSHASNIIALPDTGDLLCAWFSGDAEGGDGVAIVVARLESGSEQWTKPMVVSRERMRSAQNPVMFVNDDGEINLLHTSQKAYQDQGTSEVRRLVSRRGAGSVQTTVS